MNQGIYELNLIENPWLPFRAGLSDGRMGANNTVNWHENIEILYCSSGEGVVRKNGTLYPFKKGDIVVVNSEEVHNVQSSHVNPRCSSGTFRCITIDRRFCEECGIPSTSLIFQSHIRNAQMEECFTEITQAYDRYTQTGDFYDVLAIRALTLNLLCRSSKDYLIGKQNNNAHRRSDALKTAVTYIREHLSESITMETLTQLTCLSESTLLRRFKHAFGHSVTDTILLLRCTEARRLLETGASVTETARACGFKTLQHFSYTFKKYDGVPPSQYLQNRNAAVPKQ